MVFLKIWLGLFQDQDQDQDQVNFSQSTFLSFHNCTFLRSFFNLFGELFKVSKNSTSTALSKINTFRFTELFDFGATFNPYLFFR